MANTIKDTVGRLAIGIAQKMPAFFGGQLAARQTTKRQTTKRQAMEVQEFAPNRMKADIAKWRRALKAAESPTQPERRQLWELYADVILDSHLAAALQTRTNAVTGSDFALVKEDGTIDTEATRLLNRPWFSKILTAVTETAYYGHTLIELGQVDENGELTDVAIIPRLNVEPVQGIVYLDAMRSRPFTWRGSAVETYLLEIGSPTDKGLLNTVVPITLYKRVILEWWARFCELFGIPFRVAKTDSRDDAEKQMLFETVKNMGSAAFGVVPTETTIDFVTNSQSDSWQVFAKFLDFLNAEISKAVNTVTMLNDNGSSRSQAEVHLTVFERLIKSHAHQVADIINFLVLPKLANVGYDFAGLRFVWQQERQTTFEQEVQLLEHYDLPPDFFAKKYNLPVVPKKAANPAKPPVAQQQLAHHTCPDCGGSRAHVADFTTGNSIHSLAVADDLAALMRDIEQAVYDGTMPADTLSSEAYLTIAQSFSGGFLASIGIELGNNPVAYDLNDIGLLHGVRNNVFAFAGAKSFSQMQALRDAVYDADGVRVPYTKFRELAKSIRADYLEQWMEAEYQAVVTAGTMAGKWQHIWRDRDLYPYLTDRTQGDDRVRDAHVALNAITRPVDDPFWTRYYPPNGWNCRCFVRQASQADVDEGRAPLADPASAMERGKANTKPYWRGNVGLSEVVFKDGHPYYKSVPGAKPGLLKPLRYGLQTLAEVYQQQAAAKFPPADTGIKDREAYYKAWDALAQKQGGTVQAFAIKDVTGVPVAFDNKFREHPFDDPARAKEQRWQFFGELEAVITDPDQVWSSINPKNGNTTVSYFRFYQGQPLVVVVEGGQAQTFYRVDLAETGLGPRLQSGILIHKKTRQ